MFDLPSFGPKGDWFAIGFISGIAACFGLLLALLLIVPKAQANEDEHTHLTLLEIEVDVHPTNKGDILRGVCGYKRENYAVMTPLEANNCVVEDAKELARFERASVLNEEWWGRYCTTKANAGSVECAPAAVQLAVTTRRQGLMASYRAQRGL
jgi:hypothetical protein